MHVYTYVIGFSVELSVESLSVCLGGRGRMINLPRGRGQIKSLARTKGLW